MKKPLDRVSEAYHDQINLSFGEKVRKRIHWVCEQAKGEKILDVGCSQGITSILLGRESKQVFGIDLLQESIEYANEMLSNEAEVTKKYVEFQNANFIDYDFGDQKFDSVIFGEILEHVTDPERFINKAVELLPENGRIIVTVPFGINDYFDHKKTYYMQGLLDLQNDQINIKSIEILGKWIGAVFAKGVTDPITIDTELMTTLEDGFNDVERSLMDQLASVKRQQEKLKKTNSETQTNLRKTTQELSKTRSMIEELKTIVEDEQKVNENLRLSLVRTEEEHNQLQSVLSKTKGEKLQLQNILNKVEAEQEDLIDALRQADNDNEHKNTEIEKYEDLVKDITYRLEQSEKQKQHLENENATMSQKIKELSHEVNDENQDSYEQLLKKDKRILFLEKKVAGLRKQDKLKQADLKKLQKQLKEQKQDQSQLRKLQQQILNERKAKIKSNELLLEAYTKEERLLKTHSQLLKRYEALKNSKLGSLTISYWQWRRNRFGGKKSGSKSN